MIEQVVTQSVLGNQSKDVLLAAEVAPPFPVGADVRQAAFRPAFEMETRTIFVDALRLPAAEAEARG